MKKYFTILLVVVTVISVLFTIRAIRLHGAIIPVTHAQVADANFKVAFIGDSGASTDFQNVLNLIKSENAQMVMHQGDLDYADGPSKWMSMVDTTLGANFPYLASDGNHDEWDADGYAAYFKSKLTKIGLTAPSGSLSSSYSVVYKGIKFVFSKENGDPTFIDGELKNDTHTWKVCSWHKNQQLMQIGGKTDEQGWPDYETCRKYGAVIATAHEHSYERTKTLTSMQSQTVDPTCSDPKNLCVSPGKTFAFVSGLGGASIRNQDLCAPSTYPYGCKGEWASIYTSDQGAKFGALFIIFNYNGNPNKAHGYFKNTAGEIIDQFDITNGNTTGGTTPSPLPSGSPTAIPTSSITNVPTTPLPTTTIPAGSTGIVLNVLLHGLGTAGDNQSTTSGGNTQPLHQSRAITVTLLDQNNVALAPVQSTLVYSSSTGSYKANIPLSSSVASGPYLIKIKTANYLAKFYPGITAITKGSVATLPTISLVAGDATNDNLLSVADYNYLLDCFSDLTPARNCSDTAKKQASDITDDGNVNQFDYNLFLRELSVQSGQ